MEMVCFRALGGWEVSKGRGFCGSGYTGARSHNSLTGISTLEDDTKYFLSLLTYRSTRGALVLNHLYAFTSFLVASVFEDIRISHCIDTIRGIK